MYKVNMLLQRLAFCQNLILGITYIAFDSKHLVSITNSRPAQLSPEETHIPKHVEQQVLEMEREEKKRREEEVITKFEKIFSNN